MEDLLAAWKIDGIELKVYRPSGKLAEIDGRSPGCTEKSCILTEGLPAALKMDGFWHKVYWLYGRLRKLTKGLPTVQKVDKSSPDCKKC